jgi:hypothetical protein
MPYPSRSPETLTPNSTCVWSAVKNHEAPHYAGSSLPFYVPTFRSKYPVLEHPPCEWPSVTPIHSSRQNYSSVCFNLYFYKAKGKTQFFLSSFCTECSFDCWRLLPNIWTSSHFQTILYQSLCCDFFLRSHSWDVSICQLCQRSLLDQRPCKRLIKLLYFSCACGHVVADHVTGDRHDGTIWCTFADFYCQTFLYVFHFMAVLVTQTDTERWYGDTVIGCMVHGEWGSVGRKRSWPSRAAVLVFARWDWRRSWSATEDSPCVGQNSNQAPLEHCRLTKLIAQARNAPASFQSLINRVWFFSYAFQSDASTAIFRHYAVICSSCWLSSSSQLTNLP